MRVWLSSSLPAAALTLAAVAALLPLACCADNHPPQHRDSQQPPSRQDAAAAAAAAADGADHEGEVDGYADALIASMGGTQSPGTAHKFYKSTDKIITDPSGHVTYSVALGDVSGSKLVVLDRIFSKEEVGLLKSWVGSSRTGWMFHGLDPAEKETQPFALKNKAPWTAKLAARGFSESSQGRQVLALAESLFPSRAGEQWRLASVTGYVLRHGDHVEPDNGLGNETSLVAHIYIDHWNYTYGGETLLYTSPYSPAGCIQPRIGRLAMFPASATRVMHPPTVDCTSVQQVIELLLTTSHPEYELHKEFEAAFLKEISHRLSPRLERDLFSVVLGKREDHQYGGNPEDYLTRSFTASNGRRMAIFDGFLDNNTVMALRQHVIHKSVYQFDRSVSGTDNVKWIAGFEHALFVKSELYRQLQKIVNFFTKRTSYYPHDVSCNLIRATDNTRIHKDCEDNEPDVTLLIYLNPNWTRNMYGETAFFAPRTGKDDHPDTVAAIRPRFGRIAIFDGIFEHSARPPSSSFQGARYTFAVKYSITQSMAQKAGHGSGGDDDDDGNAAAADDDDDGDDDDGDEHDVDQSEDVELSSLQLTETAEELLGDIQSIPSGKVKDDAMKVVRKMLHMSAQGKTMMQSEVYGAMADVFAKLKELGFEMAY